MSEMFFSKKSQAESDAYAEPVIAWLTRSSFNRARSVCESFRDVEYCDFKTERDGLFVGYGFAGVSAKLQTVPFAAFERWIRLTGADADIENLDHFAAHWRWRALNPAAPVRGRLEAYSSNSWFDDVDDASGTQWVPIRSAIFARWEEMLGRSKLIGLPNLDSYAAHVCECCFPPGRRSRRPAVSSE